MGYKDTSTSELSIRKKILFIDDEIDILNSLKRQLIVNNTYDGVFTSDPTKVLETIGREDIDIIVADVVMPEIDGITLLSQVKEKFPQVIRILLTAHGDFDTSLRAITEADVFGFITKPWERNYLFGHINMAAKYHEKQKQAMGKPAMDKVYVLVAKWDEFEGIKDLLSYPPSDIMEWSDLATQAVLSASGFFETKERFDDNTYTIPVKKYAGKMTIHLSRVNDHNIGSFIYYPDKKEIDVTVSSKLKQLQIQLFGSNLSESMKLEKLKLFYEDL